MSNNSREKILVVNDAEEQLELISLLLRKAGYDVDKAEHGLEAFERAAASPPDLVITDLNMPLMNGIELCLQLKGEPNLAHIPVLLISAQRKDAEAVVAGLKAGAEDFLEAPYDGVKLVAKATRLIQQKRAQDVLRESEAKYRTLADATFDAVIIQKDGIIIEANQGATQMFGYSFEELTGRSIFDIVAPEEREQVISNIRNGYDSPYETAAIRRDGSRVLVEVIGKPLMHHGELTRVTALRDITAQKEAAERLRRNEERLHLALDAAGMVTWDWDVASGRVIWSENVEEVFSLPPGSFGGTFEDWFALIHPDDRKFVNNRALVSQRDVSNFEVDYRYVPTEGKVCWMTTRGEVHRDETGRAVRVLGVCQDITDRKHFERQLEESQQRYRSLFEYNPDPAYSLDHEGRFLTANKACTEVTGFSIEQMLGLSYAPFVVPEDLPHVDECFHKALKGEPQSFDTTIYNARGERFELRVANMPIVVDGEIVGVYGVAKDVTETKRAEAELRKSEARFRRLAESNLMGIFYADLSGRVTDANEEMLRIIGYTREDVLADRVKWTDLTPPEYQEIDAAIVREVAVHGSHGPYEKEFIRKDGTRVPVLIASARFVGSEDEGFAFVLDLTTLKQTQKALEESSAQLLQAQKMEAVGQLAGGVAHDFNNLLTAINGYSMLVLRGLSEGDDLYWKVQEIKKAGERAAVLTNQLLVFSRRQVVEPQLVDLNSVVREADRMLVIGENIRMEQRLSEEPMPVMADPNQLHQVLLNLVVNARDAMPRGGVLSICTEQTSVDPLTASKRPGLTEGEYVRLSVADTGCGMDQETLHRIFEPFFTTKDIGRGTGLGLSTVYGIVRQSGGSVQVLSEPGRGTTFEVYLPLASEEYDALLEYEESPQLPQGDETLLLVEDEPAVRNLTRHILEMCGYTVLEAEDGARAVEVFRTNRRQVSLVITDVVMPRLGGRDAAELIREMEAGAKFLYMSGYTEDAVVQHGVSDDEIDFITKPFTPHQLAKKVREVLDS